MKLFLDNLFFLGEIVSLAGLALGAWIVLCDSLAGIVFPPTKNSSWVQCSWLALLTHSAK